jgi:ABC-type glycerol-3-phosphate transport system permease component
MDKQTIKSRALRSKAQPWISTHSIKQKLKIIAKYLVIGFITLIVIIPIYWMIVTSLKVEGQIQSWPPQWFPAPISFRSYSRAFQILPLGRYFLNSLIIASAMVLSNVIFCSLAGYTFARKKFFGKNFLFALILSSMMIPMHIRLIPTYLIANWLGLTDTYAGIVLPSAVTAFGIFMMRQFFIAIPSEIEDAARIDGCTEWGVLFRVVMPLSMPAVVSLALFALVWSLEDFVWPLIITYDPLMRPIQVGVTMFLGLVVYEWGPVMAMTSIMVLPLVIIYIFAQRYFVQGLTAGAVRG